MPTPQTFKEARAYNLAKRILPTSATTAELAKLPAEIRERSRFSAQTTDAGYLAKMDRLLTDYISPTASGPDAVLDPAGVRLELKKELARRGYVPDPAQAGGLQDLSSDRRLDLIIDTNSKMAYGYGQYEKQQDPDILDAYPCLELYRRESRQVPRDWIARWLAAGGRIHSGRMIARKDSPVWLRLSRFGTPYPPFDFNSGMWTEEVSRREAETLGVIKRSDVIRREPRTITKDQQWTAPADISPGLLRILKAVFKQYLLTEIAT